jgi:ubiquinone biosynthesis monooxygenase Coq7
MKVHMNVKQANPRNYTRQDQVIISTFKCIRAVFQLPPLPLRTSPAAPITEPVLSAQNIRHSAGLMRVNHAGELCAQALYLGQSLTARNPAIVQALSEAASEEADHLFWCNQRLHALNSHTSFLSPLWFSGALIMGTFAGILGDKWSLGFLMQTEQQVSDHLAAHIEKLPQQDLASLAIVRTMQAEEKQHAIDAKQQGAANLPNFVNTTMSTLAAVMTFTAYYL